MAQAGIASRRSCEEMILQGLVKVNGKIRDKLPIMVDLRHDKIEVAGRRIKYQPKEYYLLNKPKKVVCTNYDPAGRTRAIDLLVGVKSRVYPVGRLDADSQGLLILTNDGELTNRLTHPRYGVIKTYVAQIINRINGADIERMKKGIYLDQGWAKCERVKVLQRSPRQSLLEISLREGQNRQIRRMLARLGFSIRQLTRVRIGKLTLRGLGPGRFRPLTEAEVRSLQKLNESPSKT